MWRTSSRGRVWAAWSCASRAWWGLVLLRLGKSTAPGGGARPCLRTVQTNEAPPSPAAGPRTWRGTRGTRCWRRWAGTGATTPVSSLARLSFGGGDEGGGLLRSVMHRAGRERVARGRCDPHTRTAACIAAACSHLIGGVRRRCHSIARSIVSSCGRRQSQEPLGAVSGSGLDSTRAYRPRAAFDGACGVMASLQGGVGAPASDTARCWQPVQLACALAERAGTPPGRERSRSHTRCDSNAAEECGCLCRRRKTPLTAAAAARPLPNSLHPSHPTTLAACSTAHAMAQGSAEDFQAALDRIAGHLTSENSKDVAAATVTITLMLQNTQNMPADLAGIVERLVGLLESQELAIQARRAQPSWDREPRSLCMLHDCALPTPTHPPIPIHACPCAAQRCRSAGGQPGEQ